MFLTTRGSPNAYIQTKEEKLSVLNGYNSEYYEQQNDFFEILRELMHIYGAKD
jgi:hypothetical protein